ncbi:MAG: tRNA epoxyqueuosine(34) reductase QueG [Methylobacteriaceae bacterium]|nr:tRNA epoxyqueuosine(34) reductase QueG [Methylobacteriaceae bacterium]
MTLSEIIRAEARALGFDDCRVLRVAEAPRLVDKLSAWLAEGCEGDMTWMRETMERRADPRALWAQARSIVMLTMNYGPDRDPLENLAHADRANISVYARHRDYHDIVKGKLKLLASKLVARAGGDVKVFVDTAPVMEKPLAERAGLGWQGKHTNLVSRRFGSWLFLGSIFTTLDLQADEAETDHCGVCDACIRACPTQAIVAPYRLDARRCISYLTIEHKGAIPHEFRESMGNRIYGCDDCLAVCPWNKFASTTRETKLAARNDLLSPSLGRFLAMDEVEFRTFFSANPVKRIGHARFLRNVLVAAGNSGDVRLATLVAARVVHASPVVRGAAIWALARIDPSRLDDFARQFRSLEMDPEVCDEWRRASHTTSGVKT